MRFQISNLNSSRRLRGLALAAILLGLIGIAARTLINLQTQVQGILPVANGGTGTASPSLVAGTNVTVTGSWPNQTVASTGGGITLKTNGVNNGSQSILNLKNGTNVTITDDGLGGITIASTGGGGSGTGYAGVNAQSGTTYTTVIGDAGELVTMNNASANTATIPPNSSVAYTVGTILSFTQLGVGQTTIAAGAGVTINTPTSLSCRAQYSVIFVTKIATDTWVAAGDLQ